MNWRGTACALILVLLAGAGGACTASGVSTATADAPPATTSATSSAGGAPAPPPAATARRVGAVTPEEPTSISLPDGQVVPVLAVSTTANGLLDVPEEIRTAGWWRGGSRVGDPFGSTLIAAHVDSTTEGLGPFATLLGARPGQQVVVRTKTLQQTFEIRTLRLRPRGSIGPRSSLHSPEGVRRLTLVTCASPYIPALGGYQNLAVVVAEPVGEPVARVPG